MKQLRNLLDTLDLKIIVTTLFAITCFSNSLLATCIVEGNSNDESSEFELSMLNDKEFNGSILKKDYFSKLEPIEFEANVNPTLEERILNAVKNNEPIQLDLFVMSQCSYGVEAEKIIIPIVKQYPDIFALNIYYIADEPKPGEFESMHGQTEVDENIRQLIIQRLYPDLYYDYLLLRAENYNTKDWEEAGKYLGFDINKIQRILETDESKSFLRNNIRIGKNQSIYASPTLMVNNKEFEGRILVKSLMLAGGLDRNYFSESGGGIVKKATPDIGLNCGKCEIEKQILQRSVDRRSSLQIGTEARDILERVIDNNLDDLNECKARTYKKYTCAKCDRKIEVVVSTPGLTRNNRCQECLDNGDLVNRDKGQVSDAYADWCLECDGNGGMVMKPEGSSIDGEPCKECPSAINLPIKNKDEGTTWWEDCKDCDGKGELRNNNSMDPGDCMKCKDGAVESDDTESCDDNDPCTINDRCVNGVCTGDPDPSPTSSRCGGW